MSKENNPPIKPEIIKANYALQDKVGSGPLDKEVVEKCQMVVDSNTIDFTPMATEFLENLQKAINHIKTSEKPTKNAINDITAPVMQLKANAAMFQYHLIGSLANVMLSFLEAVTEIDDDVIAIIQAHHHTLHAIVLQNIKGSGGENGKQLEGELKDACKRYFKRKMRAKK